MDQSLADGFWRVLAKSDVGRRGDPLLADVVLGLAENQPTARLLAEIDLHRHGPRDLADGTATIRAADPHCECRRRRGRTRPIIELHLEVADREFQELGLR